MMAKRLDGKIKSPNNGPGFKSKADLKQMEQQRREEKASLEKQKDRKLKILEHQVY